MWWFFDIETYEWDRFVHAAAHAEDGRFVHMSSYDDLLEWYESVPSCDLIWAHSGGSFDFLALIDAARKLSWTARMAGSAIVSCRAKGYAECRDSMRLFPGSLAKWTQRKEKLGLPCICGKGCDGFCQFRPGMSRAVRQRMIEYNDADCLAGLARIRRDVERLTAEGLDAIDHRGLPRLTFGSIAWHTASRMAGIDPKAEPLDWSAYEDGRRCYYGGRCEVGRIEWTEGHRYDVNAMYPWALTFPVPHGRRATLWGYEARRAYDAECPGSYYAHVEIGDTDLPPLPHRYNEPKNRERLTRGRLVWSTGSFSGWYTQLELAAAEQHGAKISNIESGVVWEQMSPLYRPYVEHVYDLRDTARAAGDDRWAGILKWYANALTGKLAQHPHSSTIKILSDAEIEPLGWDYVGGRVWAKITRRLPANARPIEAAYLTSRSRVLLLDRLARHSGKWLYCDTDATYLCASDDRDVHATELGRWKYEGVAREWRALAPKLYRYRDEEGPHVKAKGIPRPTWDTIDELAAGQAVTREIGVERLKRAARARRDDRALFWRRKLIRSHRDAGTDRCGTRFVQKDGTTRPLRRSADGVYS